MIPAGQDSVIHVDFGTDFRKSVSEAIRVFGVSRVSNHLIAQKYHPSFVAVLVRSIMGKEGW